MRLKKVCISWMTPTEKLCNKVLAMRNGGFLCTFTEFEKNKADANFQCKHIAAVISANHYGVVVSQGQSNGHSKPKLNEEFIKEIDGKSFVTLFRNFRFGNAVRIAEA